VAEAGRRVDGGFRFGSRNRALPSTRKRSDLRATAQEILNLERDFGEKRIPCSRDLDRLDRLRITKRTNGGTIKRDARDSASAFPNQSALALPSPSSAASWTFYSRSVEFFVTATPRSIFAQPGLRTTSLDLPRPYANAATYATAGSRVLSLSFSLSLSLSRARA